MDKLSVKRTSDGEVTRRLEIKKNACEFSRAPCIRYSETFAHIVKFIFGRKHMSGVAVKDVALSLVPIGAILDGDLGEQATGSSHSGM